MGLFDRLKKLFASDTPKREIPKAVVPNPFAEFVPEPVKKAIPQNPVFNPYPDGFGTEEEGFPFGRSDDPRTINVTERGAPEWWWDKREKMWVPDKDLEPNEWDRYSKSPD